MPSGSSISTDQRQNQKEKEIQEEKDKIKEEKTYLYHETPGVFELFCSMIS